MIELRLNDSHERLRWVRVLINRIAPIVSAINEQARFGAITVETACDADFEYARFALANPIPVPDEIGFTIADIAVNARSCLDMAITAVADAHAPGKIARPQFPIENDIADISTNGHLTRLRRVLPAPFLQVLDDFQPRRDTPYGRSKVPINRTALMIREISNTNKHRNITPTIRTPRGAGFTPVDGLNAEYVPASAPSPWPHSDTTVLEVRYMPAPDAAQRLPELRPFGTAEVMVHATGYGRTDFGIPIPISAIEFLDLAPKYVEHVLRVLRQAHDQTQHPQEKFSPNWSTAY